MKKIIATTTINPPTEALLKYAKLNKWTIIVAGDKKTNHSLYSNLENVKYMSPTEQEEKYPKLSELIGWNCIQRRNIAILEAYNMGADFIGVIDDDNIPYDNWGEEILVDKLITTTNYLTDDIAFDSLGLMKGYEHLWHRGFPLERIPFRNYDNFELKTFTPDIQVIYWNGDPDVDAVCRMIYNPSCNFDDNQFPFTANKPSPFNSQNIILSRSIIKDYFLFPYIGRMDDIWAAYYVQAKGYEIVFTKPGVYSDRTLGTVGRYSAINDMKKEYLGMENNLNLIKDLTKDPDNIKNYLPEKSWLAFLEWKSLVK
jgi:hypothetical protein